MVNIRSKRSENKAVCNKKKKKSYRAAVITREGKDTFFPLLNQAKDWTELG